MKTKEEKISKLEEKIKVTNLKIYKENLEFSYTLKGIAALEIVAATLLTSTVCNIFDLDLPFLSEKANEALIMTSELAFHPFSGVPIWTLILLSTNGIANALYEHKVEKIEKLKFFLENKDVINMASDENINILEAKHIDFEQLEEYAERGKAKVLKNNSKSLS